MAVFAGVEFDMTILLLVLAWCQEPYSWKIHKDSAVEYKRFQGRSTKAEPGGVFFFASEFGPKGGNRITIHRYRDLPWHFLFQLPPKDLRPGRSWGQTAFFFHESSLAAAFWSFRGAITLRPIHAEGRYLFKKLSTKEGRTTALFEGRFTFFEIRRDFINNAVRLSITKNKVGTLTTASEFDVDRGLVARGAYTLDLLRAQERVWEKDEWRVRDRRIRETGRIELEEVVAIDRVKMERAVDASLRRAVAWLKKRQTTSGGFGTTRTTESASADLDLTGLCMAALRAAGLKPDDPSIRKGAQHLRAGLANRTPQTLGTAIQGLLPAGKETLSTQDRDAIRSAARILVDLRDPDSKAWAEGPRGSPNVLSTRHAVLGLHGARLAGKTFPSDVARFVTDTLTEGAVAEDKDVEPAFEFHEKVENPFAGEKRVTPASRPASLRGRSRRDPTQAGATKGHALTVLAVLDALAMVRDVGGLTETQKKTMDLAVRKGLAWLQAYWTLRSPPPSEAAWSVQTPEYLHLLARVFRAYGVKRVRGADWYLEGAYYLLRNQFEDGSWDMSGGRAALDTACAILFLVRRK